MRILKITLKLKRATYMYEALLHLADFPDQCQLDPIDFYERWGGWIPRRGQYEIQIIEPKKEFLVGHGLHIHLSRTTKAPFVCYPARIDSPEKAMEIFLIWCLGTLGNITQQIALNTVFDTECYGNLAEYIKVMEEKYGIKITEKTFID